MKKIRRKGNKSNSLRFGKNIIKIRRAREADLDRIVKISTSVREIENYSGQQMTREDFLQFVRSRTALMFVAEVNGETIGYITVYKAGNYFYLPYAVVDRHWRGQGVGGALLKYVEGLAQKAGAEYILMSVYKDNSKVHSILKLHGYKASRELIQYSKVIKGKK
ncbi:MAG: GNAT family N-acetyltransferase [Candidatus Kryptoniota bacterium]